MIYQIFSPEHGISENAYSITQGEKRVYVVVRFYNSVTRFSTTFLQKIFYLCYLFCKTVEACHCPFNNKFPGGKSQQLLHLLKMLDRIVCPGSHVELGNSR